MVLGKFISKLDDVYHGPARHWILSIIALILHTWLFAQVGQAAAPHIVEEVRFRSESTLTRVVIETNGDLQYAVGRLPTPERLYVDLLRTRLASGWQKKKLSVNDARITAIRVAQHRRGVVRVVVDIKQIKTYKVFSLQTPYRIVIDLQGIQQTKRPPPQAQAPKPESPWQPARPLKPEPASRQASPPTIVIDPGHGGKDPGAIGPRGLREKTVVLRVAKALRQLIHKHLPRYRVIMTRETDVFVPLTERTKLANDNRAEVFLSIHANASKRRRVRGIETWYFSFEAKTERAQHIAARENNMSSNQFSELERILRDLHETDRINQSALLAGTTQKALVDSLSEHGQTIPDRGVDGAPFIVLLRTEMPSILVEIGFLTNKTAAVRLRRPSYQHALARGIFQGLYTFLSKSVMKMD
jgi:N-acetylmuramoyl-L-alanine amidase